MLFERSSEHKGIHSIKFKKLASLPIVWGLSRHLVALVTSDILRLSNILKLGVNPIVDVLERNASYLTL